MFDVMLNDDPLKVSAMAEKIFGANQRPKLSILCIPMESSH